jgi:hypothetical protein
MVIEHTFVTTMPSKQALGTASEMLARGGFVAELQEGFRVGETEWTSLQMKRGRKNTARAKDPTECPQRIRLDWDRGRVTFAGSIEAKSTRRTFYWGGVVGMAIAAANNKQGKSTKDYTDMMILIATALEELLARRSPPEVALQGWIAFQDELKLKAKKARRRSWIMVGILLAVIVGFIVLVAVLSTNHR